MGTYEFAFVVDHRLSGDERDTVLHRADDVTAEREHHRTLPGFDRDAETLAQALEDVEAAGLRVGSVRNKDLVTPREIAAHRS